MATSVWMGPSTVREVLMRDAALSPFDRSARLPLSQIGLPMKACGSFKKLNLQVATNLNLEGQQTFHGSSLELVRRRCSATMVAAQVETRQQTTYWRPTEAGLTVADNQALELDTTSPSLGMEIATFAGGCFWGLELLFQRIPGVLKTRVGYTQGTAHEPSYHSVCSGKTLHAEAVQVEFNPSIVSYEKLLASFWDWIDPTTLNRQGMDSGTQYRTGVYFHTDEQEAAAKVSLQYEETKYGKLKLVTELLPARTFYEAEEYHQQFLVKGGRAGLVQSPEKGCTDPIRRYG